MTVAELQQTIRHMEEQRQLALQKRRRRLAILGGSLSLFLHVVLMVWLALVYRGASGGGQASAGTYHLAILHEEELTNFEQADFDELQTEAVTLDQASFETAALTAATAATAELSATSGAMPTLGGAGEGGAGDLGLGGGGGATTSFFGISSKGTRFAYIVDISGSMSQGRRMQTAMRELTRSIDALPDFAYFYILLFNHEAIVPPMQKGWNRARKPLVRQFINWLNQVDPTGGTQPRSSFMHIFGLDVRPDVIYFMTDGEFSDITAEEIVEMNRRGKRAVIHTIQFGDRVGEDLLRQIARGSGGTYRFVPAEGE